jgi:hypothetical protein
MAIHAPQMLRRFAVAVAIGVVAGLIAGSVLKGRRPPTPTPAADGGKAGLFAGWRKLPAPPPLAPPKDSAGWRYAEALVREDWDSVIALTLWMQERLARSQTQAGGPEAQEAVRRALAQSLAEQDLAGNQLAPEGVEDAYVFSPGASLEFVGQDVGKEGLERPVAERIWIRVTYPARERALRNSLGLPIHSLRAGINISSDGFVLKGNVVGNLDIDLESIRYDWGQGAPGE